MSVTIYHNPLCGTSRGALAIIRERGIEPTVIEYLKTPLSADQLKALIAKMGCRLKMWCGGKRRARSPPPASAKALPTRRCCGDGEIPHPDEPAHRGDGQGREAVQAQ